MKTFYQVLANTLVSGVTTSFLWFALTFWVYLETESVLATAFIGGSYMLIVAFSGLVFGTFVDKHKKKSTMLISSLISLVTFSLAALIYFLIPESQLLELNSAAFGIFVLLILIGAVVANMRAIALSTLVTLLVKPDMRDRANGMVGTVNGISFTITSVFSGLVIGILGMNWALIISVILTLIATVHLLTIEIAEKEPKQVEAEEKPKQIDLAGALEAIRVVPGLIGLIFFATFNNFLGGVFMALMDPYGLNLVEVEAWGILLSVVSSGFIIGGMLVSKRGLGNSPLKTLFLVNLIMWTVCIFFTIQASIILLALGMFTYMLLIPVVEAAEQTIIQQVVPLSKQGRVFGFAQSIESAASPITAFAIGPIAQFFVIPFMEEGGAGAKAIGRWFGVGADRGMALIFIVAGLIGLAVTLAAMRTRSYKLLSKHYAQVKVPATDLPASPLV